MEPVVRITGRDVLSVRIRGLSPGQTATVLGAAPVAATEDAGAQAVMLTGTAPHLRGLFHALSRVLPPDRIRQLNGLLDNHLRTDYKIDCNGTVLDLGARTHLMGILNVTPDSFSDGGVYLDPDAALQHARDMVAAGADIIDIGGESTRPGSQPVPEDEELRRVLPLIERITAELATPVSIDTHKSAVADKALAAGASIINDISGLRFSPDMASVAAARGAAVVIMHIQGTPRSMQQDPVYGDVVDDIRAYLEEGIAIALRAGVDPEKILIDPGIGFGKTLEHNLTILRRLDEFRSLGRPLLLGTSRKKFIGTVLGIDRPSDRIDGTAATVALGIRQGAAVVRVHDVARMAQVARMTDAIVKSEHDMPSTQ